MNVFKRSFLTGLPIIATVGILVWAFTTLDGFLAGPQRWLFKQTLGRELVIPGVGIVVILVATLAIGFLVSQLATNSMKRVFSRWLDRVPLVKMLFGALRDLFNAFVGDNKSFDHPVLVRPFATSQAAVLGFVTNSDLSALGLEGLVAVYLPQSYNFAGNVIMLPRSAVTPLTAPSGDVMKFILSGGISNLKSAAPAASVGSALPPPATQS